MKTIHSFYPPVYSITYTLPFRCFYVNENFRQIKVKYSNPPFSSFSWQIRLAVLYWVSSKNENVFGVRCNSWPMVKSMTLFIKPAVFSADICYINRLNWCDSSTDGKVRMGKDDFRTVKLFNYVTTVLVPYGMFYPIIPLLFIGGFCFPKSSRFDLGIFLCPDYDLLVITNP